MLKKNIYILYPAGWHGNYVKWAIEVSDPTNTKITRNPINTKAGSQYGGVGTSHHHSRVPTHQAMHLHVMWMIYNRPTDHRVYLLNSGTGRPDISTYVADLLLQDPTGIVINLHDGNDPDYASYGRINCVTKWPTFMPAAVWGDPDAFAVHEHFDPFDCAQDIKFRNYVIKNHLIGSCGKPDRSRIKSRLAVYQRWFDVRNKYQPHEVNHDTYPVLPVIDDRFFDFSLSEILSLDFPRHFVGFLEKIDAVDRPDISALTEVHDEYVNIQPNLSWFESLRQWKQTGNLDSYLLSHSIIESEIVARILNDCNIHFFSESAKISWLCSYNELKESSWPDLTDPLQYFSLPEHIQKEITQVHGLGPICAGKPDPTLNSTHWETLSTSEINELYQSIKN